MVSGYGSLDCHQDEAGPDLSCHAIIPKNNHLLHMRSSLTRQIEQFGSSHGLRSRLLECLLVIFSTLQMSNQCSTWKTLAASSLSLQLQVIEQCRSQLSSFAGCKPLRCMRNMTGSSSTLLCQAVALTTFGIPTHSIVQLSKLRLKLPTQMHEAHSPHLK